jgi:hypothetical protein
MNFINIKIVLDWLKQQFENNFDYCENEQTKTGLKSIKVTIYDNDEGWIEKFLFFDKQGNVIPNYDKQIEIKKQIKELQKELKKLQKKS